jgi:DNA-binding phage protein
MAEYLIAALETDDPAFIARCVSDVARARGMAVEFIAKPKAKRNVR